MDGKKALKKIRDLLEKKKFAEALTHCEELLNESPDNYMALIFAGLSKFELGEIEHSIAYYNKALSLDPEKPLAWQGLYNVFAKSERSPDELLLQVLSKLIDITENAEKKAEYEIRLVHCQLLLLKLPLQSLENVPLNSKKAELITQLFASVDCLPQKIVPTVNAAITLVIENSSVVKNQWESILNFSRKNSDFETLKKRTLKAFETEKDIAEPIICVLAAVELLETKAPTDSFDAFLPEDVLELMEEIAEEQWEEASTSLLKTSPNEEFRNLISFWISLKTAEYEEARKHGEALLNVAYLPQTLIKKRLAEAYFGCGEFEKAESIVEDDTILLAYIKIELGKMDEARELIKGANCPTLSAWFKLKEWENDKKNTAFINEAKDSISQVLDEGNDWTHFVAGKIFHAANSERGIVLKELLTSAKLNPYRAETFAILGDVYKAMAEDGDSGKTTKAIRCYERSWELNSSNLKLAEALSDSYAETGKVEEQKRLLEEVTEQFSPQKALWAWLKRAEIEGSVEILQKAADSNSSTQVWECLGDAYLHRGSYESALKAYKKADSFYAKLKLGQIYVDMGQFYQAIQEIEAMMSSEREGKEGTESLEASLLQYLLAQAYFGRYQVMWKEARYGRALLCLSNAISSAKAVDCEFAGKYGLLGSAYVALSNFPHEMLIKYPKDISEEVHFKEAIKYFGMALKINPELSSLWEGLGIAFHRSKSGTKALTCFKKAAQLTPHSPNAWILLGVAEKNRQLSQHYFIRALQLNARHAGAWTSLGLLYFSAGDVQLAHKCFCSAQAADPDYPNAWALQAIIAQSLDHHDALDLMRHSVQLKPLDQVARNYAFMLLEKGKTTPLDLLACRIAADALHKNCEITAGDSWNLLGCLYELDDFEIVAKKAYVKADLTEAESNLERLKLLNVESKWNCLRAIRDGKSVDLEAVKRFLNAEEFAQLENFEVLKQRLKSDSFGDITESCKKIISDGNLKSLLKIILSSPELHRHQNKLLAWLFHELPFEQGLQSLIGQEHDVFLTEYNLTIARDNQKSRTRFIHNHGAYLANAKTFLDRL